MKIRFLSFLVAGLATLSLLLAGCGGKSSTRMDTAALEQAFSSADAALKGPVDTAVKHLNSGRLLEGTTALAELGKSVEQLNDAQKDALLGVATTIQTIMSEDGDKADLKVYQAVENLVASIAGRQPSQVGVNPDAVRPKPAQE